MLDVADGRRAAADDVWSIPRSSGAPSDRATAEEGCLSLPGQFADVTAAAAVKVRFLDGEGEPRELEADGLLARCLQHEIDHLDGILFVDHLSALKRNMIMRKLTKTRRPRA